MACEELAPDEEIVREIVLAEHVQNGRVVDTAFTDLFAADEENPGGSSCTRLKLNARPTPSPPRDGLAQARVGALPRGLLHERQEWEAFAASVTDGGQREDHAEVRARRATDAPDVAARRPEGKGKTAREFRKFVRMEVARAFRPL